MYRPVNSEVWTIEERAGECQERGDSTYRPKIRMERGPARESNRTRRREQVDYSEAESFESDTSSENTLVESESGFRKVKELGERLVESDWFQESWTTNTF